MLQNTVLLLMENLLLYSRIESLDFTPSITECLSSSRPSYSHAMVVNKYRSLDAAAKSFFGFYSPGVAEAKLCLFQSVRWNTQSAQLQ